MRFVKCAEALKEAREIKVSEPVDFCFDLLKSMQYEQSKQWSILYDVRNMRIYFRTARGPNIRYFDFNAFDFSDNAPPLMVEDIDKNIMGDFSDHFVGFTPEADRVSIGRFLRSLVQIPEPLYTCFRKYLNTSIRESLVSHPPSNQHIRSSIKCESRCPL